MPKSVHAILAVVLLAACGGDAAPRRAALDPADTVAYTMRDVREEWGSCRAKGDTASVPCVKVDISWPELAGDSVRVGAANAFIHRLTTASFQNGNDLGTADSVVAEMKGVHAIMADQHRMYSVPWLLERQVTVACNDARAFGIRVTSRQDTGGPHAVSATRYANFDARTGEAIGLASVLRKGKERELRRAAAKAYAAEKEAEKAVGSARIVPDSFPLPQTVLACGDSLVLQYDVIPLGPHRVVDATVHLGPDALKGLLRD